MKFVCWSYMHANRKDLYFMKDYLYREPCDDFPVAMAYVPWQHFKGICENLEKGYCDGTIFPELDRCCNR